MSKPLPVDLAQLERGYLLLRSEVDAGRIPAEQAAELLADAAMADISGALWWVDYERSGSTASFVRMRDGMVEQANPSEFRPAPRTEPPDDPEHIAPAADHIDDAVSPSGWPNVPVLDATQVGVRSGRRRGKTSPPGKVLVAAAVVSLLVVVSLSLLGGASSDIEDAPSSTTVPPMSDALPAMPLS